MIRGQGAEAGDWCTPPEPEAHDDGGLAQLWATIFPEE
jgi:hypothetical protein